MSPRAISHFTHFLLISYYDLTSLQSISLVNIFLGLQFHTSNCLMSLSFYMFHTLKSRDLKSICVPYWARGTTSHLIVKVNFVGGGEQWSLWADSHLLLQSWVVSLDWEPKQLEKRFSIFFLLYSIWLLFPSIQKVDWESSKEGKKEENTRYYNCLTGHLPQAIETRPEVCRHEPLSGTHPDCGKRHHSAHIFEFPTKIKYETHT